MYAAIFVVLAAAGLLLIVRGIRRKSGSSVTAGVVVVLATVIFFSTLDIWGEFLWFEALGYSRRFWTVLLAQSAVVAAGALAGFLAVYLLTLPVRRSLLTRYWPELAGLVVGAGWGSANWQGILLFLYGGRAGLGDPILGRDAGFYLFTLPFYNALFGLGVPLVMLALAASVVAFVTQAGADQMQHWMRQRFERGDIYDLLTRPGVPVDFLYVPAGAVLLLVAWWHYLGIYMLMYSEVGVVFGPGWTDVHIRLPGHIVVGALALLFAIGLLAPPLHGMLRRAFARLSPAFGAVLGPAILVAAVWAVVLQAAPALTQWLVVTPNEITLERPYIVNNIRFTRLGFGLDRAEEGQFPMTGSFTAATVASNKDLLDNVRLWDWRALDAVYRQFQAIRLYYDFHDVDIDRYRFGGQYRQVMLSARELNQASLPAQSQTFVNQRFKYTHGYGMAMSEVSKFTPEGLPNLLVKDIPPVSQFPELRVDRPEIYYGEETNTYVVANSSTPEFDYPKGEENAYVSYAGRGGVPLESLWRKFLFGWKFDGTRFFFSSYPRSTSRVMFHRNVKECVETLAPFLEFDSDPYIVLVEGRLYWIIDAYTTSSHFPYSTPYHEGESIEYRGESGRANGIRQYAAALFDGANYARNSVKAVVDAYDGAVSFYVFQPQDPLIQAWQRIFPNLFRAASEMPPGLRAHVRYPHQFLLAQGLVHAKYHMEDPVVFYNQEDLWVRATEKYAGRVQAIEPYYVMWAIPGSSSPEFSLILPFTPKNRQVLIGWIAGLCDGDDYGRLISYRFPKEKLVIGPQQVETKIDQDAYLSGQLTLWDQHGSHVIRGDVLAIPIDDTLLYVEPIYLQADTAAYPELRLVALMQGDTLAYAETFEAALARLLAGGGGQPTATVQGGAPATATTRQPQQQPPAIDQALAREAREAFENYLRLQGEGKFTAAAQQLERLRAALQRLAGEKK
jgi:hypothetical protein